MNMQKAEHALIRRDRDMSADHEDAGRAADRVTKPWTMSKGLVWDLASARQPTRIGSIATAAAVVLDRRPIGAARHTCHEPAPGFMKAFGESHRLAALTACHGHDRPDT
jgi:hypothetical protein